MVTVPALEVWGWLCSQPGQLTFIVFWHVSFPTLYISDWCPAFHLTLLILLSGNITFTYELSGTFESPSWLIWVWGAAPSLLCSSVRDGFLNRSWDLQGTAPLHPIVCIFLHKCTENSVAQRELEGLCWRGCPERGWWVQLRWGQSGTCAMCRLEILAWCPLQGLGWHFKCAQLNKGGLNSASFSEASAALAWLAKMLGNLASNCVNWLVCRVLIWKSIWIN